MKIAPQPKLTWLAVVDRWSALNVPKVAVLEPDRSAKHWPQRWVNADGSPDKFMNGSPAVTTGEQIAAGFVTRTTETYAAFALLAFLGDRASPAMNRQALIRLARSALQRLDARPGTYWTGNAKHLMPILAEAPVDFDVDHDWTIWVDLAAERWRLVATRLAVFSETTW